MAGRSEERSRLLRRRAELLGLPYDAATNAPGAGGKPLTADQAASQAGAASVIDFLAEVELKELGQIEAALSRIERGNYGLCTACGKEIDVRRLRALPHTPRCVACARTMG